MKEKNYTLICVGTGFATTFFLHQYLKNAPKDVCVLVLEKGLPKNHKWYMKNHENYQSNKNSNDYVQESKIKNKDWRFNIGFGGGSYVWWGETPRFRENDFSMYSTYGHGTDWPINYDTLEPYYCMAENIMSVAGPDISPNGNSYKLPQHEHKMHNLDKLIQKKYPNLYFSIASAKPSETIENRPKCCSNNVCSVCPIDSKFTVNNSMMHVYEDPRVTTIFESQVISLDIQDKKVKSLRYIDKYNNTQQVFSDLFCLGANPIFNSHILLQSNMKHPLLGKGLCDHRDFLCNVYLDNYDRIGGEATVTANSYIYATDELRKEQAGCIMESYADYRDIRLESGKYLQKATFLFAFEDLPQIKNYITTTTNPKMPKIVYNGHSNYTQKGIENLKKYAENFFKGLPVERFELSKLRAGGTHIYGGTVMSKNESDGIVDKNLMHHKIRNLIILGGGTFPTTGLANPTLTIAALSLYAADQLFKGEVL